MSMVARTNPGPAEDDITDTDDGDTRYVSCWVSARQMSA
ncbi:Uncharacterised protein [Escherichia coli]|nr:Uncharacterised protein [Escherichia coli]